jgi:predicted ATPase/class 3 adenylate cyclase
VQVSIRFGNVEVRPAERQLLLGGEPVALGGRAFDLLLALLERRDRVVTKNELFELVWPGLVVEENNLQVQISALRKLLGAQAIATVAGRGYRFVLPIDDDAPVADAPAAADQATVDGPTQAVTYLFTDVEGSTRLWEEQPQAMQGAMARHEALCRELVAHHGGRIVKLTGDGIHAFFAQASSAIAAAVDLQIALQELQSQALPLSVRVGMHRGLDMYRDGDFYGSAVNRAARVMSAAHGGQVLVSHAVVEAIGAALPAGVSLRDLGAVRLRDLSGPERLYQVIHERLRLEFPPLRSLEATPNNLPQQLNSFINRYQELSDVPDLLANNRLVTLLAMGGIGKSRLAAQLGAHLLDRFPDGVWLVELAPVTDPCAVPQALASALGVREEPGASLTETLLRRLCGRQLLVLLDNCEHLVEACAQLTKTLLQGTTGLKVLATSRDPLNIAGEASYPLRPLAVPASAEESPDALMRHAAVQLFVERARAAQPSFRLQSNNAAAIADIASRLDGIPLAIELAAARVRVLTPDSIASRLDQRFKLLVAGDRTVLPRQKTLKALIDWSYDLLPEQEARLFARLSVFSGGWALEAAERVCASTEDERQDVLLLLGNVVQKSLVTMDLETGRYRMLETVREYAFERLATAGEVEACRRRHLAWCVDLAETAFPHLMAPEAPAWLWRLDAEHENITAALRWALPLAAQVDLAQRLVFCMRSYWITRGLLGVAVRFAEGLLLNPALASAPRALCRALFGAGQLLFFAGHHSRARVRLGTALEVAKEHGLSDGYRQLLQPLGVACLGEGDLAAARAYLNEGLELAAAVNDPRELASAVTAQGMLLRMEGNLEQALAACERALELLQGSDTETVNVARLNLAMVFLGLQRLDRADALLTEILQAARQMGAVTLSKSLLEVCCGRACALEDFERAALLSGAAGSLGESSGLTRDPADEAFLRPLLDLAVQRLGAARFMELSRAGRDLGMADALELAESALSQVEGLAWRGQYCPD